MSARASRTHMYMYTYVGESVSQNDDENADDDGDGDDAENHYNMMAMILTPVEKASPMWPLTIHHRPCDGGTA